MTQLPAPDFHSPAFLRQQVLDCMAFYQGRCIDPSGGLYQFFKDDGSVYDRHTRHLVSSTRFVITHANAARHFPEHPLAADWLATARHALHFVQQVHRQPGQAGYAWLLHWEEGQARVLDGTQHCYGLAFVLLAHAQALRAGIDEARPGLFETLALMEQRFWEPAQQLYADEISPDGQLQPYRGQNANMHACEALMAAFEATGHLPCLLRAAAVAESVTQRLAAHAQGLIWEHYRVQADGSWLPDWNYNRHDRSNIFRPWGFQVGHLTEWAKLLLTLERLIGEPEEGGWMLTRARQLFDAATRHGWDEAHGGLVYGIAPDGNPAADPVLRVCDGEKYHWVQAESLAAAAALAMRTGETTYREWYERIWTYAWAHFVDHQHGAWFRILGEDNRPLTDEKSPAGKVDYHNMGACLDVLSLAAS